MEQADDGYNREETQKSLLHAKLVELQDQKREMEDHLAQKKEALEMTEKEPGRLLRQITSIEGARNEMEQDHRALLRRIKAFDLEQEGQAMDVDAAQAAGAPAAAEGQAAATPAATPAATSATDSAGAPA